MLAWGWRARCTARPATSGTALEPFRHCDVGGLDECSRETGGTRFAYSSHIRVQVVVIRRVCETHQLGLIVRGGPPQCGPVARIEPANGARRNLVDTGRVDRCGDLGQVGVHRWQRVIDRAGRDDRAEVQSANAYGATRDRLNARKAQIASDDRLLYWVDNPIARRPWTATYRPTRRRPPRRLLVGLGARGRRHQE